MNGTLFSGFIIATIALMFSPGPSCALAASQALRYGANTAGMTILGDALASLVHIAIVTFGFQLFIEYSAPLLPWVQIFGGIYILSLAYQNARTSNLLSNERGALQSNRKFHAAFVGFIARLSNPKAIIFFIALFPGFIDPALNIAFQSFIYGIVFVVIDVIGIIGWAFIAVYFVRSVSPEKLSINIVSAATLFMIAIFLLGRGLVELVLAYQ